MHRLIGLTAGVVLMAASGASAQVTGIVTDRSVNYLQEVKIGSFGSSQGYSGPVPSENAQLSADVFGYPSIDNYQVSTKVDNAAGYIAFADNATSSGADGSVTTTTSIAVSYTNSSSLTINPMLNSTITPGGFGVYVGSLVNNPTLQNPGDSPYRIKAPIVTDINQTPEATDATLLDFPTDTGATDQAPYASISFQILSGSTVVASYQASLTLYENSNDSSVPVGEIDPVLTTNFSTPLNNFGLIDADDATKAIGYSWDETDISVPLGDLGPGASSTLTYVTSVTTSQFEAAAPLGDALIVYSGFGDPIGKAAGGGGISDPHFGQLDLGLPELTVDPVTGDVTLTAATFNGAYSPALRLESVNLSAPEPQAWVLMLAGVGLAGAAARSRAARRLSIPRD
jgi:hypothetical protein